MRPLKSLISLEEAKKLLFTHLRPVVGTEKVSIEKAQGRVLSRDITASLNVPPFSRAAMDGYAVRAEDTYPAKNMRPVKLTLTGSILAGQVGKEKLARGECIQIATGSPVPPGADAVVMFEDTEKGKEGTIKFYKPVYPQANISSAGEDVRKGQKVASAGDLLTPGKVGVLAALGKKEVQVFARPRVFIVSSGEEIISPGEPLGEGEIYDVNSYTLLALLEENGCQSTLIPPLKDNIESITRGLRQALAGDMVIVTGGSSVGERDLLIEGIKRIGGKILFHGIAVKPGKPTLASLVKGKLVLGMPGYPTSCLTNGYGILVPLVRKLAHLPSRSQTVVKALLARRVTSTLGRHQFLPVRLNDGRALPVFKESGAITSMSEAEGYIEIPANVDLLDKEDEVQVKLF